MKFYRLSEATFYDCINTISQFIQPFLDKCQFLRIMKPLDGEIIIFIWITPLSGGMVSDMDLHTVDCHNLELQGTL